jgi:hypothetical protein
MKTNHNSSKAAEEILQASGLEENSYIHQAFQWALQNGRHLFILTGSFITLLIILYKLAFAGSVKEEKEFFQAENAFVLFQNSLTENKSKDNVDLALDKLEKQLDRLPELHAKYDGAIAQALLSQGASEQAKPFAEATLARTLSENKPFYSSYGQTTLLIADHNYSEALRQALLLKQNMLEAQKNDHKNFGEILFAYNLLRIGMLQQQVGASDDEFKTWQEWQQYMQGVNTEIAQPQAFEEVSTQFSLNQISLKDYIESRQKTLRG